MHKVLVVMSTYNGEKYLNEQIESILRQRDVEIDLVIRDDGSKDITPSIIAEFAKKDKRIIPIYGNNIGFRKSFYNTLIDFFSDKYDYYAFSDQDDVWLDDKLSTAIRELEKINGSKKLYASSLNVVDQDLNPMYVNSFKKLKISYGSALSRQRLAGCSMVFDKEIVRLCRCFDINQYSNNLISHDGAVYFICLACGGTVFFDRVSHIKFRRHHGTVTEHGKGFLMRFNSIINIFGECRNIRFEQNKAIYETYNKEMPNDIKELSEEILSYKASFKNRINLIFEKKIKCNIKFIDFVYCLAILIGCY